MYSKHTARYVEVNKKKRIADESIRILPDRTELHYMEILMAPVCPY